jgi:GDP-mannose 6-dehydrogenase
MRISVLGLGYVGTVSAACLAARGHEVIGVDVNAAKVDLINKGQAPILEADVSELVAKTVACGRLSAVRDTAAAIAHTDLSIVCVGTPGAAGGAIDRRAVVGVCSEIGEAIRGKTDLHTIVVRSTVLPGTFRNMIVPALESASGREANVGFKVALNPEFMREGTAVADFANPSKTVIGGDDAEVIETISSLYADLPGRVVRTTPEIAEIVKYVDNSWHALKVTFANEVGNICQAVGVDSHAVMDIFVLDEKLNISKAYLRPGFAFGGSCLPKDVRAICHLAQQFDLNIPVLKAITASNQGQIERAIEWVLSFGKKKIGVLGCAFKEGTDDLRESPFVILIERLLGKGCELKIFDTNIHLSLLTGANRDYITATIPHIASLMVESAPEAVVGAELVLVAANTPEYVSAIEGMTGDQQLLDFVRVSPATRVGSRCHAINW